MKCTTPSPPEDLGKGDGVSFGERNLLHLVAAARAMAAASSAAAAAPPPVASAATPSVASVLRPASASSGRSCSSPANSAKSTGEESSSAVVAAAAATPGSTSSTALDLMSAAAKQDSLLAAAAMLSAAAAASHQHQEQQQLSGCTPPPPPPPASSGSPGVLVNGCKDPSSQPRKMQQGENSLKGGGGGETEEKKVHNNNTSSYVPGGGRLKFFKEGRCLLELTHRNSGDRGDVWIPITKKVYWPPTGGTAGGNGGQTASAASSSSSSAPAAAPAATNIKSEGSTSAHSAASDTGSNAGDAASIPSPWQGVATQVDPLAILPDDPLAVDPRRHRRKSPPRKVSPQISAFFDFYVRPPPCVVTLRKKIRGLRRRRRRPHSGDAVVVAALMLRLEAAAVRTRPRRKPIDTDYLNKSARLAAALGKLPLPVKKKPHLPVVPIQPYVARNKTKKAAVAGPAPPPAPPSRTAAPIITSGGVTKVKSELFPVTETCTAANMPNASASQQRASHKKSNGRDATSARSSSLDSPKQPPGMIHQPLAVTSSVAKTLPITPTLARIKSETNSATTIVSSTLVSPDLQRVKVEIGTSPGIGRVIGSASESPQFISPRKRLLQGLENGGSPSKKHRLSTDSRGSVGSSGDGANSPHPGGRTSSHSPASPFGLPLTSTATASPPRPAAAARSNSFSIDSIISRDERDVKPVVRPVAVAASPARLTPQTRSRSPPDVKITPYASREADVARALDPRLAHLAGVSADPRLGLTPTGGAGSGASGFNFSAVLNPYYSAHSMLSTQHQAAAAAAAASLAAASQLAASRMWTPPVSSIPSSSCAPLPETFSSAPPASVLSSSLSRPSQQPRSSPLRSPLTGGGLLGSSSWGGGTPQYRGEPRVATPASTTTASQAMETSSPDAPLNLSTKR